MARFIVLISILFVFEQSEQKLSGLFDDIIKTNQTYQTRSKISKTGYTLICWISTINEIIYKNGTTSQNREVSIIFEKQLNTSVPYYKINNNQSDHTFTTQLASENFTININKSIICGGGDILSKKYTKLEHKERLQIDIASELEKPKKLDNPTKGNDIQSILYKINLTNHVQDQEIVTNRVKKEILNDDNPNKIEYKAVVSIKLYKTDYNDTEQNFTNILIGEDEVEHFIRLNHGHKPVNVGNKSVLHVWNKLSRILAYKLFDEHRNETSIFVD